MCGPNGLIGHSYQSVDEALPIAKQIAEALEAAHDHAHVQFFKALADDGRDEALAYFQKQIDDETEDEDKPMLAFVLADLLTRLDKTDDAVELASKYLRGVEESPGFSFSALCMDAGRLDLIRETARETGDVVTYTATLLQK